MDRYSGSISYVTHHRVAKPDSTTTPLRIVTNSSLKNRNANLSPKDCMSEGPNALSSLLEVLLVFRMLEVALVYDMSKAYQSISTRLVLELVKKLAAELGTGIDTEACQQNQNHTYVDDGAGGGSQDQVERFRGRLVDGTYDGTLARILRLVNLHLKVMGASGDTDSGSLALLGETKCLDMCGNRQLTSLSSKLQLIFLLRSAYRLRREF